MSEQRKDGGRAFPSKSLDETFSDVYHDGMSLRDWFAGQALAGAGASLPNEYARLAVTLLSPPKARAKWAFDQADAMLAAREDPLPREPERDQLVEEATALLSWVEEFALPAMGDDTEGGNAHIASFEAALSKYRREK